MKNKSAKIKLWQPFRIGQMELRNRIVMAPMETNYGTGEGFVSDQTKAHYEARAKGGVGLIIVEATSIDLRRSRCRSHQLAVDNDKFIHPMKEMVDAVHRHGASIALQMQHGGGISNKNLTPLPPMSASAIYGEDHSLIAGEMTLADISSVVKLFARAARRAQQAGFDGVEIHGAHRYLIAQFLSPAKNKRTDAYGGNLKNRARFLMEIIAAIRAAVGAEFPVWSRLNAGGSGLEGDFTPEETRELLRILQGTSLDAVSISGMKPSRTFYSPQGYFVELAGELKKVWDRPLIVAGGINAQTGEKALEENKADMVAMGRALLADAELPNKLAEGRWEDIRPCIRCASCNDDEGYLDIPIRCVVNAAAGRDKELIISRAKRAKKVVVIGGGPAGLEAARVAAMRGHHVTLFEKGPVPGGQMVLAAVPPHKELIAEFRDYLLTQIRKQGVKVELSKEVSASLIQETAPDAVIIATGSSLVIPEIPGINRNNVCTVEAVFSGAAEPGQKVVIIGGGTTGCEAAHYLVEKGKQVTIVEILDSIAPNVMPSFQVEDLLEILKQCGVTIMTGTRVEQIVDNGLIVTDNTGNKKTILADTIVLATGRKADNELYKNIKEIVPSVFLIGDAARPNRIREAVETGFRSALAI